MKVFFQIAILILYFSASDSSIYSDVTGTLSQYLKSSLRSIKENFQKDENAGARFKVKNNNDQPFAPRYQPPKNKIGDDKKTLQDRYSSPKTIIRIFKSAGGEFPGSDKHYPRNGKYVKPPNVMASKNMIPKDSIERAKEEPYHLDGVLNSIRRTKNMRRKHDSSTTDSESSSMEMREWKNEWKELWIKKKIDALNQTAPQGDTVNMVAARPWGVPCGDPNQHDMPWGTCMLAMECEPEYRIYRGDFQCGRTQFVCCAMQLTNYDMYQGFDVSFADSGLSTDSDEQRNRGKGSSEKRRKRRERERRRRRKARRKRKKKIKKNIKKIIKEIRKILNRQYRNGTSQRKKKTKQLKKFIKTLKKKYRQDRKSVKNIHEIELVKIDSKLIKKLQEIKFMNQNFVKNETFRQIVVNGTINKTGARMLVEAYPELLPYFTDGTRRSGDGDAQQTPNDYKDYDVEYGMLYY